MKTINNEVIRSFGPCYDPSEKNIPDNETLTVAEWVERYREVVSARDILWLLLRKEFLSDKDLRLFAVWCAREALKLIESPHLDSVNACNIAEKFANGGATKDELAAAWAAAGAAREAAAARAAAAMEAAAWAAAREAAAWAAARAAAWAAAGEVAWAAAGEVVEEAQLNELLTYFK